MDNEKGRGLVLGTCLFFALGLVCGIRLENIMSSGLLYTASLLDMEMDIRATFFNELKYILALCIAGFLMKAESLVATVIILKGFFVGCGVAWIFDVSGLRGLFLYIIPLQFFSSVATVIWGGGALYGCKADPKAGIVLVFLICNIFLIFLGTVLEALILKII